MPSLRRSIGSIDRLSSAEMPGRRTKKAKECSQRKGITSCLLLLTYNVRVECVASVAQSVSAFGC
ncbi:unnamed protein product [Onchocerca flexuosa]|uniref:Uncharacterized protein n=1 Tax=Onchocerca flexuosa TaxID=387005 RepID=A0A183HB02_9BILA|nr:unnamed protein product [Onchocerca flexuosa]